MAAQPTYTARSAWTYPFESAWARLSKFQTLNRLSWQQLTEALSILRTTNAACGIDLRSSDSFDIPNLVRTLGSLPPIFKAHFVCGATTK
jgi:hypothetical protein